MMNASTDYNGWKNRSTWNIALWLNNDYGLYLAAKDCAVDAKRRGYKLTGIAARRLCRDLFGPQTPDGIKTAAKCIDWKAIADTINEMAD